MIELTNDSLYGGRLKIKQAKSGYRFSMDAIMLANQAEINTNDRVLDLGTGCGVISLILAYLHPKITVYGVEIQKKQADIAALNVRDNNLEERVSILNQDIKALSPHQTSGTVDIVICNPPHIEKSCGRINPNDQLAISRHEIKITLDEIINVAERMLCRSGRLFMVYPAKRMVDLIDRMRSCGIEPKKMSILYTKADAGAKRILMEGVKGGRPGIKINKPLIIHNADGTYTATAQQIFGF
ncbi:MAG: tRNA1(Val) (adenine(37)-N6)-methyltransferase [Desulfobacteraceae bacterium]|nr:tRNA1(Val) (adenine(37)-N6)-methyltransferase [Desulfobacteraceae bacterium]MBC2754153.1 tRNA1(Val) (adenine(37)-N6)-methyltransferase [Desulfobacteraceae bacterium]